MIPILGQSLTPPCNKFTFLTTSLVSLLPKYKLGLTVKSYKTGPALISKLAFAAKAVPAGHLFLRCLIILSTKVDKLHDHVWVNIILQVMLYFGRWLDFPPGTACFIEPGLTSVYDFDFYTNALENLGVQCILSRKLAPPPSHQQLSDLCLHPMQELFCNLGATLTWDNL